MRVLNLVASAVVITLGVSACSENTMAPRSPSNAASLQQSPIKGSGVALNLTPQVTLPILGTTNLFTVNSSVISNIALVQNTIAPLFGLDVTGTLTGTEVDAMGNAIGVLTSPFTAEAALTSSGNGQCSLVSLDLSGVSLGVLNNSLLSGTVPATVTVKGSGAIGSLLCNLGTALGALNAGLPGGSATQGLVNAVNNQLGG